MKVSKTTNCLSNSNYTYRWEIRQKVTGWLLKEIENDGYVW
jgi:hypothetical protein